MPKPVAPVELEFTLAPAPGNLAKRRASVRYHCQKGSVGRLLFPESGTSLPAWIQNLSEEGIGLHTSQFLSLGTSVVVRLAGPVNDMPLQVAAQVVSARLLKDGHWRIGCCFEKRIGREQLEGLLQ